MFFLTIIVLSSEKVQIVNKYLLLNIELFSIMIKYVGSKDLFLILYRISQICMHNKVSQ